MFIVKRWAFNLGKKYLLSVIDSTTFKDMVIKSVNDRVDIPKLNERQEEQLFRAIFKAVTTYIKQC